MEKSTAIGFVCGDMLGLPFEFKESNFVKKYFNGNIVGFGTHNQPAGTWSDDTSIMLCAAKAKTVEEYKVLLKRWRNGDNELNCDYLFDIGNGIKKSIDSDFTCDTYLHKGNGCLSVTVGCFISGKQNFSDYIKLTHNNETSLNCSDNLIKLLTCPEKIDNYAFTNNPDNSGYCEGSLDIAINSVKLAKSFKEGVVHAIEYGGDTDSNGAITGAILSNKFRIPSHITKRILNFHKIDKILING